MKRKGKGRKKKANRYHAGVVTLGVWASRVGDPPEVPPTTPTPEELAAAKFEADQARAALLKVQQQMAELQRQLPSEEQRAKWAELEAEAAKLEEQRALKAGEFEKWRTQINDKHQKELDATRQEIANAKALAAAVENELNDKLIGLEFQAATEWFGPSGKTVLLPEVAKSYFARNVEVEVVRDANGTVTNRRVIVKDNNGTTLVDAKTGRPEAFAQAIGQLVEAHPQKAHLLRGSGRVGSGSAGGGTGQDRIDTTRLRPADFQNPEVREQVRKDLEAPGGLKIGPGFDQLNRNAAQRRK